LPGVTRGAVKDIANPGELQAIKIINSLGGDKLGGGNIRQDQLAEHDPVKKLNDPKNAFCSWQSLLTP
jgi:hypothetical protein